MFLGTNPDCPQAFHHPNDTVAQVECQVDNVSHRFWVLTYGVALRIDKLLIGRLGYYVL